MSRQLVATLTTDSNGEATFTYTGTGIGKIGFDAKYGTFQSEIFEVYDTLFYDTGIDGTNNTKFYVYNITRTPSSSGTRLLETGNGNIFPSSETINSDWNKRLSFTVPFVVEFEIVTMASAGILARFSGSSVIGQTGLNDTGTYRFEIKDDGIVLIYNGGSPSVISSSSISEPVYFSFTTSNDSDVGDITYKNLKIYPI